MQSPARHTAAIPRDAMPHESAGTQGIALLRNRAGRLKYQTFSSVWDALEDTPEAAQNMKLRSALMMELSGYIRQKEADRAQAAKRLGITPACLADLLDGRIEQFSLDSLIDMVTRAGLQVQLKIRPLQAA